jgi:hypothetical protein
MKSLLLKLMKTHSPGSISKYLQKNNSIVYEDIMAKTSYLPIDCKFTQRVYHIIYDITENVKCEVCHKHLVVFRSFWYGYKRACSFSCAARLGWEKAKKTNLKKYGVEYPSQVKSIVEKTKETNRKKFYGRLLKNDRIKELIEPMFSLDEYKGTKKQGKRLKNKYKFRCKKCGNIFIDNLDDGHIPRCFNCFPIYFWGNTPQKGNYQNIRYDSSWELAFIKYCLVNDIKIERNKKGFVYWYEDKKHKYYPDFYLPEVDLFIEVKNKYLLGLEQTTEKINQFPHKLDIYGDDKIKSILESLEK